MNSLRHKIIIETIKNNQIKTQDELLAKLKEQGLVTTQATISRDIKKLGLFKALSENGEYVYAFSEVSKINTSKSFGILTHSIIKLDYSLNTVVIKCNPGTANAVCSCIDGMNYDKIVGTLAGDDTIFVLMQATEHSAKFISYINKIIKNSN